jgi:PAS domain S-box-containing protein
MIVGTDLLDRIVESCPAPLIVADLEGRLLVFNGAAEAVLGYAADEALRFVHVTDLYHRPDDARRTLARIRARASEGQRASDTGDVTLRARNGELVPVRLSATLVRDADQREVGTLGIFEDRREQIALARRLEEATGQVMESEKRAAGMALVSAAAHEMSQPLTAAMGNLEMLGADTALPGEALERVERAAAELDRLRRIVGEFTRAASTRARTEPR